MIVQAVARRWYSAGKKLILLNGKMPTSLFVPTFHTVPPLYSDGELDFTRFERDLLALPYLLADEGSAKATGGRYRW